MLSPASSFAVNTVIIVIALDFSKAFDNVRHSTLLNKMADLDIPDHVYNWLVSYFRDVHTVQDTVRSRRPS